AVPAAPDAAAFPDRVSGGPRHLAEGRGLRADHCTGRAMACPAARHSRGHANPRPPAPARRRAPPPLAALSQLPAAQCRRQPGLLGLWDGPSELAGALLLPNLRLRVG